MNIQPTGGGIDTGQKVACLCETDRQEIQVEIEASLQTLSPKKGWDQESTRAHPLFTLPLSAKPDLGWNSYYAVTNFVDHANDTNAILDYNCGKRTYDIPNYNHRGTDYILWPFPWYLYEHNLVDAVAAEPGTIVLKHDENRDDDCDAQGKWNAVYVRHQDGSIAWYGHLKQGHLTTKEVGQYVARGEFLGGIASSGRSSYPHLHFEVYNSKKELIDPYAGNCNSLNRESWWANQPPYREPTLNVLLTHNAMPDLSCTAKDKLLHATNSFEGGTVALFAAYYRDQLKDQKTQFKLINPRNEMHLEWEHVSPATYNASWWGRNIEIPVSPKGMWTWRAEFEGQTFEHRFEVV